MPMANTGYKAGGQITPQADLENYLSPVAHAQMILNAYKAPKHM